MINNSVGIGDPSFVAITNVNAQIASGIYNYQDVQPYRNFNALANQESQDLVNKEQPTNEKLQRQINIEEANENEKELELEQDKEFQTVYEQEQLDDDTLLGVPSAPPIAAPQQTQQPQQQPSLLQEDAQQQQIENLQVQQMIDKNRAMNYKLGSMDWGLNSINAVQFPQKKV
ncbi:MAG: hypothetical protein EZS28_055863, partial [Streblomastix strix]